MSIFVFELKTLLLREFEARFWFSQYLKLYVKCIQCKDTLYYYIYDRLISTRLITNPFCVI